MKKTIEKINETWGINIEKIGKGYGYYADETGDWYWVTKKELAEAADTIDSGEENGYSLWCSYCGNREISQKTLRKHGITD
jgi:hypothetical protein